MKIGVLTLLPKNNYGGLLQAAALCGYLSSRGHEVVLINKSRFKRSRLARVLLGALSRIPFQNIKNKRQDYLKTKKIIPFIESYLPRRSREIISALDLETVVKEEGFDAVIVGSDQVWRYQYIGDGHHNVYFLDFVADKPVRKIAYAASFGKNEWEAPERVAEVSHLLHGFDAISIREKSGVELCRDAFGIASAVAVLDPTLLVEAEFYERYFVSYPTLKPTKTLTTYILDKSIEKLRVISSVKAGLEPVVGALTQINLSENERGGFYSVDQWLWNIKNAEFVVTDSFHGMVFSIVFERQFIVIGNEGRGLSRFTDLLGEVGLSDRLVSSKEMAKVKLSDNIDYKLVNKKLAGLRVDSIRFLELSLECN